METRLTRQARIDARKDERADTIESLREQLKDVTAAQIYLRERDSLREQLSNMMAVVASVEKERDELLRKVEYWRDIAKFGEKL